MGVEVVVDADSDSDVDAVERLFRERDAIFSRFRHGSELDGVNASREEVVLVSPEFARAVRIALRAAAATRGLVDPTLGAALEAAGYDRDFTSLGDDPRPLAPAVRGSWRAVGLTGRVLSRPVGTVLDLNGVVKGLTVDDALGLLRGDGFVSAGGDIAASRDVVVALPRGGATRLVAGGLATTGTSYRRWKRGGVEQHHVIDPRSGRPARSCWDEVTVAAGSCLAADIAAKAAFLLADEGPAWLDERGLPGRFLGEDGVVVNVAWRAAVPEHDEVAA